MTMRINLIILSIVLCCQLNSQNMLSIYQQEGKTDKFKVYNIDSINFDVKNVSECIRINFKSGYVSEYECADVDSILFEDVKVPSKQGFVIFRVDDDHPSSEILPMSAVFDKFGYKMVNCFNPSIANKDMLDAITIFKANGHEVADHTPNHTTAYADLKTAEQINMFSGHSGVERIDGLRIYINWIYPQLNSCIVPNDSISCFAGSGTIKANFKKITLQDQIFTNEFGWVILKNITDTQATVLHAKSRQALTFTKTTKEQMYKVNSYAVYPTIEGLNALMLASQLMFSYYKIDYFKFWCMCGGPWAMGRGDIIKNAGASLGYVGGAEHSTPYGNIPITYNQNNPLGRWASQLISINLESIRPSDYKRIIANEVSKHLGIVDLGHMYYKNPTQTTLFTGTNEEKFKQYLTNLEEILQFCYDNDIPVLTYKDAINLVYNTEQDSTINIIPPMYKDLTSQGFPDGYILSANTLLDKSCGVSEDKGCSLRTIDCGKIFDINKIGGFEKGRNNLSFYAKANVKAVLVITLKPYSSNKILQTIKIPIESENNEFNKYDSSIDIPYDTDLFNISFSVENNQGSDFLISGIYIGKKKI